MDRQVVLDTETTGLSPAKGHRVIEIGCVEIVKRVETGRHFHVYLNPQRAVDEAAFNVHGLSDDFLLDKPFFVDVVGDFLNFIAGAELVIHNAPFDVGFLDHELSLLAESHGCIADHCSVLDSLVMARHKHPGQANSLDALCRRYQVDGSERSLHGALLDSQLLAQVYLRMTGGQKQLFQKKHDGEESGSIAFDPAEKTVEKCFIQKPTEEELEAHGAWLSNQQKEGVCMWPSDTTESVG